MHGRLGCSDGAYQITGDKTMSVRIIGIGAYSPEKILTNQDLEKLVETSDEWITSRTGIKTRHIAAENETCSDMACNAARRALASAGIKAEDLDFISVATASGDYRFPSTACVLQGKLGNLKCACYDVTAACSGLLYSLQIGDGLLRSKKQYRYGLVIGAEKLSAITDWTDRNTCVLFGDGAAAVILEKVDDGSDESFILGSCLGADGSQTAILNMPAGGTLRPSSHETVDQRLEFITMNGRETFKHAVPAMINASKAAIADAGIEPEEIRWVIPHQANKRIIDAVASRVGVTPEHVYINIDHFANTSAASTGLCLDELSRNGQLERGDLVLLTAFGSGLTWASLLIRW